MLHAADGDTENPSISRWAPSTPPPSEGGPATVAPDSGAAIQDGLNVQSNGWTFNIPATLEAGDLALVCLAANTGAAVIPAPPAGWTLFSGFPVTVNSNVRAWLFWGIVGTDTGQVGAPGTAVTFTMDSGALRPVGVIEGWDWGTGAAKFNLPAAPTSVAVAATNVTGPALAAAEIGEAVQKFYIGRIGAAAPSPTLTPAGTDTAMHTSRTNFSGSPNLSVVSARRTATAAAVGEAEGGATGVWSTAVTGFVITVGIRPGAGPAGTPEGVRQYIVTPGGETQLTSTELV